MIKIFAHIILFVSLSFISFGQNTYFHKVFKLPNQNSTRPYNIKLIDSTYYMTGHVDGSGGAGVLFMKMNLNGEFLDTIYHIDTANYDLAGYSLTKLDTNVSGNFMLHYRNAPADGLSINKHERMELNKNGQILYKNTLDTFVSMNMNYPDFASLVFDNNNLTYYTLGAFNIDVNNQGFVLTKFSQTNNDVIWIKKIQSTPGANGVSRLRRYLHVYDNGDILLVYNTLKGDYFSPLSEQYSKTFIEKYNSNGILIQQHIIENDIYTRSGFGAKLVNNEKELVLCLTQSEVKQTSSNWLYYGMTPSIAKLDSNFNIVWQENFGGAVYNSNNLNVDRLVNDFVSPNDSTIVYGGYFGEVTAGSDTSKSTYIRLESRNLNNGEQNWLRKIQYYQSLTPNAHPAYDIGDIEKTSDGGFILVGQVTNYDSIQTGAVGHLGYILKTNCLGYLGDPQAGFSAENNDSLEVQFQNGSLMGGSYLWDFGDGTTLQTADFDSDQPAVFHQYEDTGMFQVTLIAYGCNGVNDTITSSVYVSKYNAPEVPINPNIVNYMALGPNPVQSGESIAVYVGNLPSENCWLAFYDEQGKLVLEHAIQQSKSTNIIVLPFQAGVYQAVLRHDEDVLEIEKIIVF